MPRFQRLEVVLTKKERRNEEEYYDWFEQDEEDRYSDLPSDILVDNVQVKTENIKQQKIIKKEEEKEDSKPLSTKVESDVTLEDKDFYNPTHKVKMNKDEYEDGFRTVLTRIDDLGIKPYPLPDDLGPEFLDFAFDRNYFSKKYGGNAQQTFPPISEKHFARHGRKDFMFLNASYNPKAPQRAGFPGLFYECFLYRYDKPFHLFIRMKGNQWLYVGYYQLTKNTWCKNIAKCDWGKGVRKRVALRKRLGREPIKKEQRHKHAFPANSPPKPTPEELREEYDSGRERLVIWALKCIGYDQEFQKELKDDYTNWDLKKGDWIPEVKKEREEWGTGKPKKPSMVKVKKESKVKSENAEVIPTPKSRGTKRQREDSNQDKVKRVRVRVAA